MVYPNVLKSTPLDIFRPDEGNAHACHVSDECKGLCSVLVDSQVEANVYPYTPGALFLAVQEFQLHTSMLCTHNICLAGCAGSYRPSVQVTPLC